MPGRILKEVLENGVSKWPKFDGRWPLTSGVHMKFDPDREPGDRIIELLEESGQPVDMDKVYVVAVNDFIAGGKDGYKAMLDPEVE